MNDEEGNNLDDLTSLEKYEEKKYGAKKSYDLMYRSSWIKIDENPEKTLRFADDNVTTSYFDKFKIFGGVLDFQWRLVWDQPKWRGANCTMSGYQGIYIRNANSEEEYHGIPIYIWPYALDKVVSRFATPVNLNNPIEFAYEYGIDLIMHLLEQEGNIFDQTTANAVLFIGGHQILINKEIMFMHSSHFKQIFEEHSYNDTLNLNYTNITYHDFVNFYQMIHPKTFSLRGRDITGVMHVESILRTPSVRRHINYYFRTKNQIKCQDAVNYFVCYADTLCTAKYPSIIATMTVPTPFEKFQNQYDRLVGPPDDNIVHAMDCEFGGELMYESDCPAAHFEVDIYWSFIEDSGWECYRLEVVIALVHGSLEDYKGDKRLNPVRLNDYGSLIDCEKAVDEEKKRNPELLSFIHFTSEAPLEIRLNSYSLQEYNDLCWDFPLAEYTVPGVPWLYTYKFCLEPNGQLITKKQYETTCARKENTDTTLVVQGKHIHVNKQFLAYHSTYFANLFAQHKDIPYFDLNVNYKDMVMFLGSFASEVMVPMTSQMATLLHMAESFGVPKVKHLVEHWLDNNPFISTSDLADIAIRYNLKSLMKRVHFECAKERMDLERKKKYNLLWFWFKQRIPFMESERWLRKYESGEALRDTSANDFCFKSGWREIRQRTEEHILKIRINGLKSKWILCQLIDDCLALQFDFDWQQVKDSEKIIAFDGIIRVWVRDADLNIVEYIYQLENVENTLIHTAKDTQSLFICNKEIGEHLTSPTKCRFEYSLVPVFDRSENYEKLFQQSLTANCTLKVEGRFVHVNKEFLSYHSTVFATLLAGTRNKIPEIKDVTYEQFGMLYSIINLELFVLPDRNAKELLELAKKFKMVTVTRHVEHHLLNNAKLVPMKLDQLQNEYGINKTRNRGIAHRMEIAKNIKHSKNQNVFNQLDKFIENGLTCEFNARLTRNEDNSNVRFVLKFKWSELKALESFSLTLLVVLDNGPLEDTNCQPKKPKMERNANPILRSNYKSLQECMHACAMARQANPEQFTYIHFTSEAPLNFKYKIDLKENQRSVTINQRISQLDYPKLPWNCRYDLQIEPRFVAEHVFSESKQHNRILVVEEKELHVNKEFLECHSEFFNVLFNTTMLEGRQKKIKLGGVSYNDFAMFLSSIHPDIVFPTDDRIQTIMTVANQFLCPKVMRLAVDHLTNNSELCLFDKLTLALQFPSSTLMEKTIDKLNLEDRKTLEEKGDFETLWNKFNGRLERIADTTNARFVLDFEWNELKASECFSMEFLILLDNGPFIDSHCQPKKPRMARNLNPLLRSNYESTASSMKGCDKVRQENPELSTNIHFTNEAPLKLYIKHDMAESQRSVIIHKNISYYDYPESIWNCHFELEIEPRYVPDKVFSRNKQHDGTLVVEGKELHVSRPFLAYHCGYFFELFSTAMKNGQNKIELTDVSYDDLVVFLSSFHPQMVLPTDDRIPTLLRLARKFECAIVTGLAEHHLINNSDMSILSKLKLAREFGLNTLKEKLLIEIDLADRETLETNGDYELLSVWAVFKVENAFRLLTSYMNTSE